MPRERAEGRDTAPLGEAATAKRSVVFVMGNPRSGSTLLTLILGAHSSAFALCEMESFANFKKTRQTAPGRLCLTCEGTCPVWDRNLSRSFAARRFGSGFRARLTRINPFAKGFYEELFDATATDVLVDSSKQVEWLETRLAEKRDWRAAQVYFVFVTRDGRAAVNSWLRKQPGASVEGLAARWLRNVQAVETAFAAFDPARRMRISYEALAADPVATTQRLCKFLGLPFEPGMTEYWRHEHHVFKANTGTISLIDGYRSRGGNLPRGRSGFYQDLGQAVRPDRSWRTEMSVEELAGFERVAGEANRAYEVAS